MGRKSKSGLEPWQENCYRCSNFIRIRYIHNGVDDGAVGYICSISNSEVIPIKIDGCKKFNVGKPKEEIIEAEAKKSDTRKIGG